MARAHRVVIGLAGRAFLVADLRVLRREDAIPRPVCVVDEVVPAVGPDPVVPVPVAGIARAHREQGGGGEAFGLHPEVLVAIAHRAIGTEAVDQPAVRRVPPALHRGVEEMACTRNDPFGARRVGAQVALELQQQLGPLGEVAGLEAPGPEDVGLVAAVVVPVDRPVLAVVLPHQPVGERGLPARDAFGQRACALEVEGLARGVVGREHRLAGVHVGVLAAVRADLPGGRGLVGVQLVLRFPEMLFHQVAGVREAGACFLDAGHQRMRVRQQHEGQAVAVLRAVLHGGLMAIPVDLPCIATIRLRMRGLQERQAVAHRRKVVGPAEAAPRHRVVEHEARAAHEVARAAVVHRAVVGEEMEEAARGIAAARRVERQRVGDVAGKEFG
ncbi:hypothetical protein FQZ97_713340 [compost metagenome]